MDNVFGFRTDTRDVRYLIDRLENFEQEKAVRAGLKSAADVFRRKGLSNLRSRLLHHGGKGNLVRSLEVQSVRERPVAFAGYNKLGHHAHLVDRGTSRRNYLGKDRGLMPPNGFWTDARKSEEGKALDALYDGIAKAVERINNRR